jgi:hypothetical protein
MYLVVFYVGEYVMVCGCVGVYTKSKTSELSPLRRKLLCFAKQFPPPLRSKNGIVCPPATSEVGARRPKSISNYGVLCQTIKTRTLAVDAVNV